MVFWPHPVWADAKITSSTSIHWMFWDVSCSFRSVGVSPVHLSLTLSWVHEGCPTGICRHRVLEHLKDIVQRNKTEIDLLNWLSPLGSPLPDKQDILLPVTAPWLGNQAQTLRVTDIICTCADVLLGTLSRRTAGVASDYRVQEGNHLSLTPTSPTKQRCAPFHVFFYVDGSPLAKHSPWRLLPFHIRPAPQGAVSPSFNTSIFFYLLLHIIKLKLYKICLFWVSGFSDNVKIHSFCFMHLGIYLIHLEFQYMSLPVIFLF